MHSNHSVEKFVKTNFKKPSKSSEHKGKQWKRTDKRKVQF